MLAPAKQLLLLQELDDHGRTSHLADDELNALRAVGGWIRTFVISPHEDLGRAGPVCPFVPEALERRTLWLCAEHLGERGVPDLVELMNRYRQVLLRSEPSEGENRGCKALVIVLAGLSAARAKDYLDDPQVQELKRQCYVEDGVVIGDFHARNEGAAIRNPDFHPFRSPVPFLLMRHGVLSDWMFFLDNDSEDWLAAWERRFRDSAFRTLAEQLRRTNWRQLESGWGPHGHT